MHTLQQCITAYRIDNFLPPFRQQRVDLKLNKITIFREETKISLSWFSCSTILSLSGRIGIWRCCLENRRKPSEQGEKQQQTPPTYGTGNFEKNP